MLFYSLGFRCPHWGAGGFRGVWDFFVRDYQGNVRMILTEETHNGGNSCTMETARAANEEPVFGQVDAGGIPSAANEVKARFAKPPYGARKTLANKEDPVWSRTPYGASKRLQIKKTLALAQACREG
jgi:hypothetical protein